MTVGKG